MTEKIEKFKSIEQSKSKKTGAHGVLGAILGLFKSNPDKVTEDDGVVVGGPYQSREVGVKLPNGKKLCVRQFSWRDKQDTSFTVSDHNLPPGTPMHKSRPSYRVDIKGGEAASSYEDSIGFATSDPALVFTDADGHKVIISDNWAETESDPDEVRQLLKQGKLFRITK